MPRPSKPKTKASGASTRVKVEVEQTSFYEDYVQLKIEGIDFSALQLDKKSVTTDIAVDVAAFEPPGKPTKGASKPKQRKYSWWEKHPLFPPNAEVDVLEFWTDAFVFNSTPKQIWLSGYWVYDPDRKKASEPALLKEGRPVGISIDPQIGKPVFYPESHVRLHQPGTPHYSELWQSR